MQSMSCRGRHDCHVARIGAAAWRACQSSLGQSSGIDASVTVVGAFGGRSQVEGWEGEYFVICERCRNPRPDIARVALASCRELWVPGRSSEIHDHGSGDFRLYGYDDDLRWMFGRGLAEDSIPFAKSPGHRSIHGPWSSLHYRPMADYAI